MRDFLATTAGKRFDPFDPTKTYEPKEVWRGAGPGDSPSFTGTSCGLRLRAHGDWSINQLGLAKGTCLANFSTGPYKAIAHNLRPSILLMVKRPDENQTLADFARKYSTDGSFQPYTPSHCPSAICISLRGVQPGMYKKDGDGHGRIVVFERDQPEFPGLVFESPWEMPKPDKTGKTEFYHPGQINKRIPGKLYYLVLLDTASSIEEPALKDLDFFLQNLTVE
jgi:hypothetical protein